MAGPSVFSTAENFQKASDAERKLQEAITEATTAVNAGIPGAEQVLANAQEGLKRVQQFISVYFPNGAPST